MSAGKLDDGAVATDFRKRGLHDDIGDRVEYILGLTLQAEAPLAAQLSEGQSKSASCTQMT